MEPPGASDLPTTSAQEHHQETADVFAEPAPVPNESVDQAAPVTERLRDSSGGLDDFMPPRPRRETIESVALSE